MFSRGLVQWKMWQVLSVNFRLKGSSTLAVGLSTVVFSISSESSDLIYSYSKLKLGCFGMTEAFL